MTLAAERMDFEDALAQIEEAVFTHSGKYLSEPQILVLRGSWENRTYDHMAAAGLYSAGYLRQDVGPKLWDLLSDVFQAQEKVGKKNFRLAATRWLQQRANPSDADSNIDSRRADFHQNALDQALSPSHSDSLSSNRRVEISVSESWNVGMNVTSPQSSDRPSGSLRHDWGTALPASTLYGRDAEQKQMRGIIEQGCRLVMLTGMGGIGKSALAWSVAQALASQYHVFWRSLHNQSPLDVWQDLQAFLEALIEPEATSDRVGCIIQGLSHQRCLIVLDSFEIMFESGHTAGRYQALYREYEHLIKQVMARSHRSCLLLTSREVPADLLQVSPPHGQLWPVQPLEGEQGQFLFELEATSSHSPSHQASQSDWHRLMEFCAGNPQVLQAIAKTLHSIFDGNVAALIDALNEGYLPSAVRSSMAEQLERLSADERNVLDMLAIAQYPLSLSLLRQDLVALLANPQLPDTLDSLLRRSLIQPEASSYRLTPVLEEYVREQFVHHVVEELTSVRLHRFLHHPLVRADSRDDIRYRQQQRVLQPIIRALQDTLRSESRIQQQLQQVLSSLRSEYRTLAAYGAGNIINLYRQMGWSLEGMDFSGLPVWQACLDDVSLARVNLAGASLWRCKFSSCFGSQPVIALEQSGQLLAVGDRLGQLLIWNLHDNQQQILLLDEPASGLTSLAIHPHRPLLASGHQNQRIYLWNIRTGRRINVLIPQDGAVTSLSFNQEGDILASGGSTGWVQCWDMNSPNVARLTLNISEDSATESSSNPHLDAPVANSMQTNQDAWAMPKPPAAIRALVWGNGDRHLVSLSEANEVVVWDGQTGDRLRMRQSSETAPVKAIFFASNEDPEGQAATLAANLLSTASAPTTAEPVASHPYSVASVIMVCIEEGLLHLFDLADGRLIRVLQGQADMIGAIAISPTVSAPLRPGLPPNSQNQPIRSFLLATANSDQTIRVWNLGSDTDPQVLCSQEGQITSLALASQAPWLATASNQAVSLWDLQTGTRCRTLTRDRCRVCSLAVSPNGATLAVGNDDCTVKLWDVRTDSDRQTLRGHLNWVYAIAFSPDQRWCASGSDDGTIKLWDVHSGESVQTFIGHRRTLRAIAFSPDGQRLASVDDDGYLKLWETHTGHCLNSIFAHDHRIFEVQFSPRGDCLATGSADHCIGLWSAHTLDAAMPLLQGHRGRIHTVAFSPTGDRLLSGSDDQTVRLWDLSTGTCEQCWDDGASKIHAVAFNTSGEALVCASHQGLFGVWNFTQKRWMVTMPDDAELVLVKFGVAAELLISVDSQDQIAVWPFDDHRSPRWFQINPLYKNMNISGVEGINDAQKKVLHRLGAIEQ